VLPYRGGLRVSEVLALRPRDADLARHSLRLMDTKSDRAQTLGCHPTADDALARWLDHPQALGISGRARLFCALAGDPVSDDYVRGLLRRRGATGGTGWVSSCTGSCWPLESDHQHLSWRPLALLSRPEVPPDARQLAPT
jgi:site-specific recombinase XerC